MILVVAEPDDPHALEVTKHLTHLGANYVCFHTVDFPNSIGGTFEYSNGKKRLYFGSDSTRFELADITTVWFRRLFPAKIATDITPEDREFALAESEHFLQSAWRFLRHCYCVNPRSDSAIAASKPYQLSVAQSIGFEIPRTLVTNETKVVLSFFDSCLQGMIYKPLTSYARNLDAPLTGGAPLTVLTSRISKSTLEERLSLIAVAPCIFQEYVPKDVELRITVVGRELFCAAIHSQKSEKSKHDWRRYDLENTPYTTYELPDALCELILKFMDEMGLEYGCLDFILTPDGRYVFLEVNPGGQWLWVEYLTGLPITQSIALLLSKGVRTRRPKNFGS